ncbi:MAG: serine hydrolase [Acidobacteria bacterium]|nr:serine hydrolase [Acidobacteriota bacterium]
MKNAALIRLPGRFPFVLLAALLSIFPAGCAGRSASTPPVSSVPAASAEAPLRSMTPPPLVDRNVDILDTELQEWIPALIKKARIPGLQAALIRDGRIVLVRGFGVRNRKTQDPVTDGTIFEAASLTKPFFAYYVMKLIDQGVLELDKPLLGYIPVEMVEAGLGHPLSEPGFHREWLEKITIRHVLSHSAGTPHGESGKPFPLFFEPGTKWKYSADGYEFLQKIIEHLKGDRIDNLMRREVLEPLGMTRSCLVWKPEYEATMANGHDFFGRPIPYRKRTEAIASATLYTTAEDYAKFVVAVLEGRDLKPVTFKEMLTPQIDMDKDKGLGWSLGFGTQRDANGLALWQWGDYGVFRNYVIAYPEKKAGLVYLTNSFLGLSVCSDVVGRVLGGLATGNLALNYWPYDSPRYQYAWDVRDKGSAAAAELKELSRKNPGLFTLAYIKFLAESLSEAGLAPQSLAVLKAYAAERPQSGSARLELAKAYITMKDCKRARRELDKTRAAAEDKVESAAVDWYLDCVSSIEKPVRLDGEYLKKIAGNYGARHLLYKNGRLSYMRDGRDYPPEGQPLIAISPDTFFMENLLYFRIKVEFDASGNPVKLIGLYVEGLPPDESPRDK